MPVNLDKPQRWKADVAQSVDLYNDWFLRFAPQAFRATRLEATQQVEAALASSRHLTGLNAALLRAHPSLLPTLRMSTCPPLAVDRLVGLAGVPANLVKRMEDLGKLPVRMAADELDVELAKIAAIVQKMADPDLFVWLGRAAAPTRVEIYRAATIVADRLCGAIANPIIRNAQEQRQLAAIQAWLEARGYRLAPTGLTFDQLSPGHFAFRLNLPVKLETGAKPVKLPVDVVVQPLSGSASRLPLLIEAKSAGDFTNTNKRRKEEATKVKQLRDAYGDDVRFALFLCGYFDRGYLGYAASDGIDWVWEHRIDDLAMLGL